MSVQQSLPVTKTPAQRVKDGLSAEDRDYQDVGILEYLYVEQDLSTKEIANDVFDGEISDETIRLWVNRHGLNDRAKSEAPTSPETQKLIKLRELADQHDEQWTSLEELIEKYGDQLE
ncbi:hypothetical protein [Natronosalvus amylolyticus]|uniref:hypothetical protein n=1 Tax=Natronosalvus amylolyticus TaxID=2961994 RepID=UPI0020C9F004|nr:hypothetical protein [Natronosalvus amylolyticus]